MNSNDLMNAVSGIDPKYIDEAAWELHEDSLKDRRTDRTKILRMKKFLYIAVPAAAAVLFTLSVAFPFLKRMNTSDSATCSGSKDAAADTAPAYEAESAAPAAYDAAEEAVADAAPAYEQNEADAYEKTAGTPELSEPAAMAEGSAAPVYEQSGSDAVFRFEKAVCQDGILTVELSGALPADVNGTDYAIIGTDENGSERTVAEGTLGDILIGTDPLTLDLSGFDLPEGTYTLSVGTERIDFNRP